MSPSYYAIIPASVRYDVNLKPNAKLLYGEITALCNLKGFCWADNQYFSDLYQVDKKTISRWISQLSNFGYIEVELFNNQVNRRRLTIDKKVTRVVTKKSLGSDKKVTPLYMINNTINNIQKAVGFLIENYPIRFEQEFLMRYQKDFISEIQFNEFLEDFNDEVIDQGKEFSDRLFGMLSKYCRNWLKVKNKSAHQENHDLKKLNDTKFN